MQKSHYLPHSFRTGIKILDFYERCFRFPENRKESQTLGVMKLAKRSPIQEIPFLKKKLSLEKMRTLKEQTLFRFSAPNYHKEG